MPSPLLPLVPTDVGSHPGVVLVDADGMPIEPSAIPDVNGGPRFPAPIAPISLSSPVAAPMSPAMTNPALRAQAMALERRRAQLAERARQAAEQVGVFAPMELRQPQGFRSAVTGADFMAPMTKRPLLGGLAPLIAETAQRGAEARLDKDITAYGQGVDKDIAAYKEREQAAASAHMARMPSLDAPVQERMRWAQAGTQIPSLAPVMQEYVKDTLIAAPTREAARKWEQLKFDELKRHHTATEGRPISVPGVGLMDPATRQVLPGTAPPPNLVPVTNPQTGDVSGFNPRTGGVQASPGGAGAGAKSAEAQKREFSEQDRVRNATTALKLLDQAEPLLSTATSSGAGTVRDIVAGFFGKSTEAGDAAGELQNIAARLLAFADKSGLGPQFSDADRKFLESSSSGGIGDPTVPESRKRAVLTRIRNNLRVEAGLPPVGNNTRESGGPVTTGDGGIPTVTTRAQRDALEPGTVYRAPDGKLHTR